MGEPNPDSDRTIDIDPNRIPQSPSPEISVPPTVDDSEPTEIVAEASPVIEEPVVTESPVNTEPVVLNDYDATISACVSRNVLSQYNSETFQYLLHGCRASHGVKSGRYYFEARLLETPTSLKPGTSNKNVIRIGFSTEKHASHVIGDGNKAVGFDNDGHFFRGDVKVRSGETFALDDTVGVLIDLMSGHSESNTVTLYKNGTKISKAQPIPLALRGQVFFPTVTFKNVTAAFNFGEEAAPWVALPFPVTMIQQATVDHLVRTTVERPADGKYDIVVPVGLPGEGIFEYVDNWIVQNPGYLELSDRCIVQWCERSGLKRSAQAGSKDTPDATFQIPGVDDFAVRHIMHNLASINRRNCIIVEIKNNLLKDCREKLAKRFNLPCYRRRALVCIKQIDGLEKGKKISQKLPDINPNILSSVFRKFCLPEETEGFELEYLWANAEDAAEHIIAWCRKQKVTQKITDIKPSDWFKDKVDEWLNCKMEWRRRQKKYQEKLKERMKCDDNASDDASVPDDADDEVIVEDYDVWMTEDINDVKNGVPMYAKWHAEDWSLANLRYEIHLLIHAFKRDVSDPEFNISAKHFPYYYNLYYKRQFSADQYGHSNTKTFWESLDDVVAVFDEMIESEHGEDTPAETFVRLTEFVRRERCRKLIAGNDSAKLNFSLKSASALKPKLPQAGGPPKAFMPQQPYGKGWQQSYTNQQTMMAMMQQRMRMQGMGYGMNQYGGYKRPGDAIGGDQKRRLTS